MVKSVPREILALRDYREWKAHRVGSVHVVFLVIEDPKETLARRARREQLAPRET